VEAERTVECCGIAEENDCMDTMSFDLLFIASPSFHHAVANVFVKSYSGNDYGGQGTGKMFVSSECRSFPEFNAEIDRLQRELGSLRLSAKSKFERERSTRD
jgi:hypothetical protein